MTLTPRAGTTTMPTDAPDTPARGAHRTANLVSGLVVLLGLVAYLGYAVATGLPVGSALLGVAMIGLTQVLPGALAWRAVRPRDGWLLEDLAAGFAIGSAIAVPTQIVAGLTHQRWLATAIPLAVAVALVAVPVTRRRIVEARWSAVAWWFAPAVTLASLAAFPQFVGYAANNRVTYDAATSPHIDTYLHQALASELLTRGPVSWPTVAGEELGYHWFTHAWIAQVSASSGLELNEVLVRLMPALMPVAVVVSVAVAGLRLSRRSSVGVVAALLAMVGGRLNLFGLPDGSLPVMPDSPTLALGAPTLTLLVTVLALRWRGEALRGAVVLVPLLAIVAAGTKGSTSPLVVAGLGLAAVAMLVWNRELFWPTVVDLVVVAAGLGLAVIFVFKGSSAGLALGVTESARQTLLADQLGGVPSLALIRLAAALTILAGLARAALVFVLPFFRDTRRDPLSWVLLGAAFAGAVAPGIFSHPGRSQGYFYLTAIPLAALGSALGLDRLRTAFGGRRLLGLLAVGTLAGVALHLLPSWLAGPLRLEDFGRPWTMLWIALGVLAVALVAGALVGSGRRVQAAAAAVTIAVLMGSVASWAQAVPRFPSSTPRESTVRNAAAVTQGQIDVARYIRDHSAITDLVMTNRHCTVPRTPFDGCDSRRWLVTAFSERQSLVEGWTATPRATRIAPTGRDSITVDYWKPEILRLNDDFYRTPTAEARQRLWDLGVRWVYVENTVRHADSLEPYATLRFQTPDASAWQLVPPTG